MSFNQFIQYRALHHIYGTGGGKIVDSMLASDPATVEKLKMRNVCALITTELFDRLENTCAFLDISKREFIESALLEALATADKVIEETGVHEHYEQLAEFRAGLKTTVSGSEATE
jgi:hypothetical protein